MAQYTGRRWQPPRLEKSLPLFESPARPRPAASPTSRAAAASIAHAVGTIRARILEFLAGRGSHGATAEEVAASLELRIQTATARLCELVEDGKAHDSGRTRPTSSGRAARVLIIRTLPGGEPCSQHAS